MWQNIETGEILTEEEMLKQFEEDYDGLDPTNGIDIFEYYVKIDED